MIVSFYFTALCMCSFFGLHCSNVCVGVWIIKIFIRSKEFTTNKLKTQNTGIFKNLIFRGLKNVYIVFNKSSFINWLNLNIFKTNKQEIIIVIKINKKYKYIKK